MGSNWVVQKVILHGWHLSPEIASEFEAGLEQVRLFAHREHPREFACSVGALLLVAAAPHPLL